MRKILSFGFSVLMDNICCRFALVTFLTLHDIETISWGVLPLICYIQAYIASIILMNLCRVNWMQNLIWLIYFSAQYFCILFLLHLSIYNSSCSVKLVQDVKYWFLDEENFISLCNIIVYINIKVCRTRLIYHPYFES